MANVLVFIIVLVAIHSVKSIVQTLIKRLPERGQAELLRELKALREELRQLRQQNNDVILGLDSALHRVDQRVGRLETHPALGPQGIGEPPARLSGRLP